MNTLRIINGVEDHLMVRLPEWGNAIALFMYGTTLLQPGLSFASPSFAAMARLASENVWGTCFAAIGGVRLLALLVDALLADLAFWSLRARAIAATLSCIAWSSLALGIYLGNPLSPGCKTYAALLVVDMIVAVYLGRRADRQGRGFWILRP